MLVSQGFSQRILNRMTHPLLAHLDDLILGNISSLAWQGQLSDVGD
jgi:hypothetical protein